MTSSPTLDPFPLYDLNKLCFLAVAEQLDNTGRRYLSQTCQRFRRLLIPEDRYSNPPESYWEVISVDNPFSFAQHLRNVPNSLETRLGCDLVIKELWSSSNRHMEEQCFCIHWYGDNLDRDIRVYDSKDGQRPTDGLHLDNGRRNPESIIGRLPAVLYKTLYELSKCFAFERLQLDIFSECHIRLPMILSSSFMFQSTPIRVVFFTRPYAENVSDEAIEKLIDDFRNGIYLKKLAFTSEDWNALSILRKLKALIQKNHSDILWDPIVKCLYALELIKENGRTVAYIKKEYAEKLR